MLRKSNAAFTLIEMSIVLTIIALLVGGIMGGRELMRGSETKNFMSDVDKIRVATLDFRTKYQYLPGDMPDATTQWGIQAGTGSNDVCYMSQSTSAATCNGNGDGMINNGYSATNNAERGRYWQHLSNGGFISGQYTGYQGPYATESRNGNVNAFRGPVARTHYNVSYSAAVAAGNADFYAHEAQHIIISVGDFTTPATPNYGILLPEELSTMDQKFDDGKPGQGKIRGTKPASTLTANCTTSTDPVVAQYAGTQTSKNCFLYVLLGF